MFICLQLFELLVNFRYHFLAGGISSWNDVYFSLHTLNLYTRVNIFITSSCLTKKINRRKVIKRFAYVNEEEIQLLWLENGRGDVFLIIKIEKALIENVFGRGGCLSLSLRQILLSEILELVLDLLGLLEFGLFFLFL